MGIAAADGPPVGSFRVVGGNRLFVDERGAGEPRVAFLPGAGLTGLDFFQLHERVATTRSSLIYDRAGTGFSAPVPLPRTAGQVVDELHELLGTTGSGSVVLVGHSLGGLYARYYAMRYPDAVAGLVLLDPAHEDYDAAMPAELSEMRSGARLYDVLNTVLDLGLKTKPGKAVLEMLPPTRRYQRLYRELFGRELRDFPPDVRDALVEHHVRLEWLATGLRESRKIDKVYDEVRQGGAPPDLPMIVLVSTGTDGFRDAVSVGESPELLRAEVEGKTRLYEKMVAASSLGDVRLVDAGHVTLPFRQADAVVQAIADLTA